jgi:multidrug resistance efflux pump
VVLPRLSASLGELPVDDASVGQDVPVASATPTVRPGTTIAGATSVAVRRGAIAEHLSLLGRVVGAEEVTITAPGLGKVESVPVKLGDRVEEGQVLLQTTAQDTAKELATARAALETDTIRLQQTQAQVAAQADARQRDAAAQAQQNSLRQQAALADAQAALEKAQADQQKVLAGASESDKRSAQVALTTAHANVQRAEADLAHLQGGADPAEVRAAKRDVDTAQTAVDKAQADLKRLTAGPDPEALRTAERDVQRAQNALAAAQADRSTTGPVHDAAVANAQLSLQDAQDRLTAVKTPPSPEDVAAAKRTLAAAQSTLQTVQERLAVLQQGPDQEAIDQAQARLDAARLTEQNAQALLDDLNSHPTPEEAQAAAQKVAAAQATLDRIGKQPAPEPAPADPSAPFDLALLQTAVDNDQAQIERLEASLESSKLLAPFAGTVARVQVKVTDVIDLGQPVLMLVKPGDPIVRVDVSGNDASRLAVGQTATVKVDSAGPGAPWLDARLANLADANTGGGTIAQFTVSWPTKGAPALGSSVQLQVTLQAKADGLLVPRRAVRSAGASRYVQYLEGANRKTASVQVGIIDGDDAEIVSGLSEGQLVLVRP